MTSLLRTRPAKHTVFASCAFLCLLLLQASFYPSKVWGAEEAAKGPAQYIKFHPDFIVNLKGSDRSHFLMVTIQGMSRSDDGISKAKHHMAAIRHHILMLLSEQTPQTVKSVDDKQSLMAQALETVQELMMAETGGPVIEAIYFTDFVLE